MGKSEIKRVKGDSVNAVSIVKCAGPDGSCKKSQVLEHEVLGIGDPEGVGLSASLDVELAWVLVITCAYMQPSCGSIVVPLCFDVEKLKLIFEVLQIHPPRVVSRHCPPFRLVKVAESVTSPFVIYHHSRNGFPSPKGQYHTCSRYVET